METVKTSVSGSVYGKFVASLYTLPNHRVRDQQGGMVVNDYVGDELVAQAESDGEVKTYWLFTQALDAANDAPLKMAWRLASGPLFVGKPKPLRWVGWDDEAQAYVSAMFGGNVGGVLAAAKADGETVAYRGELAFVRVDWLKRRFPAACEALADVGLRFE